MFCKTCASKYSPKCGYDSKYVYDCSGFGEALKTKEKCTTTCYTYRKGGGCTGDPCVCWKKGDTCGYTFPLHCDLLNHTLYECEAAGKPPKYVGNDCLSDQTCTTYSQENDQCTTTNTCKSTTKESTCSQEYQPECVRFETNVNGTFNTYGFNLQATVDQNSKAEICPFGCSGGVCSDCECKENMTRCGYTYPRSCNLDYHRMYKCEIGKKPKESGSCGKQGCVPGFNRTAEDGSTITGPLNDTCLNNCLCRSANNVCGHEFPASCKLDPDMLYTCSGIGEEPSSPVLCKGGCMATTREHTCRDCRAKTQDVIDQIPTISAALTKNKDINGITKVIFPSLVSKLPAVQTNLTKFKNDDNTSELGWTAGYLQLHLNMTLNDLQRLKLDSTKVPTTLETQLAKFEAAVTE
ncbi:hypothetical protein K457DRAFT_133059 [Linnemannia elongata AG-77]|uniref:Uncharacterized protein n=1 Tax=Linnemannia elongata AG-77 TaxID=1314771 RepID=A0A197KBZ0_9FUNG|nr:hypothetical protein K457DRAFT_133059 [Linnemannia elongata AG-77]